MMASWIPASLSMGVIILQNGTECSVAILSEMEQLFTISLHENSSCLGLWSDIYSY